MAIRHAELWDRYKGHGDPDARAALIHEYVPLVYYVVNRLSLRLPITLDSDDLLATGALGLIAAVHAFDPARGIQFSTFAVPRIRGAILDEVRKQHWTSRTARRRAAELEAEADAARAARRAVDFDRVARRMKVPRRRLAKVLASVRPVAFVPLDQDAPGAPGMSVSQVVPDESGVDPHQQAERAEQHAALRAALAALPEAQRHLIIEYYFEGREQKDIARRLRVSRSRVSQIHSHALSALRKHLQALGAA